MVIVRPFRGLRPVPELAADVAAPPYDVLSSDEARERAKDKPNSFLHVSKPEIDLDPPVGSHDPMVHRKGSENLKRMIRASVLKQDEKPCYYVYRQNMDGHEQTGLVAVVSAEDYVADRIKKHEHTRLDKEEERAEHINTIGAHTGPVFLMMRDRQELHARIAGQTQKPPVYDFVHDYGVRHTFWVVDDETVVKRIRESFTQVDALYIADGHHRAAAGSRVARIRKEQNPGHTGEEEYNYFLAVIFPVSELKILNYNRLVRDLNGRSEEQFLAKIKDSFEILSYRSMGKPVQPRELHAFGMFLGNTWWTLRAKTGTFDPTDPIAVLDVSILQNNVLGPILGIADPRTDKRIEFVGGIRGLEELEKSVKSGAFAVAFSLYPTAIGQLLDVAEAGGVMPPKSTWFEPKLRSGLVVHLF